MKKNRFYQTLSLFLGVSLVLSGAFSGRAFAASPVKPLPGNTESTAAIETDEEAKPIPEELLSDAEAIHITNAEEFLSFAEDCTLDTWSQNKVFVLDSDLDLSGTSFSPVPTFGGCFLGQGHTISGLDLEGGSNHIGLFRYVQESGQIYQLTVSGIANAERSHLGLSLLVGCNAGYLSDCHSFGNITGGDYVGGIAGRNELTGIISGCNTSGMVEGRHLTGGITGCNEGLITGCNNLSLVNTTADHNNVDLSELRTDTTITNLFTTENAASVTDIGGIAGSNPGIIRACTNEGTIGYQHVGYNIGGIAGSQTGYIEGCVNSGHLYGRKDIGGIAGQMEPSSELEYLEDTLQKLDAEFDKLHDLLTRLDADASDASWQLTGQIHQLLDSVEGAQGAVDQILSDAGSHLEDFAALTDLTTLPSPDPLSLDFLDRLPRPSFSPLPSDSPEPSFSPLPSGSPWPSSLPQPSVSPWPSFLPQPSGSPEPDPEPAVPAQPPEPTQNADVSSDDMTENPDGSDMDSITEDVGNYVPEVNYSEKTDSIEPRQLDSNSDGNSAEISDSNNDGSNNSSPDTPSEIPSASPRPEQPDNPFAAGWPAEWPSQWPLPSPGITLDDVMDSIDRDKIEEDLNQVQDNIYEDASHVLQSVQDTLQEQASIASYRLASAQNSLSSSFSAIISDTRLLNSLLNEENQILLEDFQAIIDEIHVISNIITEYRAPDPDELLNDVSDEDQPGDITGKVMNCMNRGKIEGDLNTGGIAGSLSRENNLDPENDLDVDLGISLSFRYKERMVIRQCVNSGMVEGKKDKTGGIAGEMTMGSILECTGNGNVSSEGSMTGGIAGCSNAVIRSCNAKCTLTGKDQVGGIAGYGSTISDCLSMVSIPEFDSFRGSIAGKMDSLSSLENNFFMEGCPAGVDGVSYGGLAEPLSCEEFMALPDLPEIFRNIFLTFEADEETISVITLKYGEPFHADQLPSLPEKEGFTGNWESFDYDSVTFDRTIHAIYTEYITALESEQMAGERPILLVEGQFSPEAGLQLTAADASTLTDGSEASECWKVSITNSGSGPFTVRYLIPETIDRPELFLYEENSWRPVASERDGSYLVFPSEKAGFTFACANTPSPLTPGRIISAAVLAGILLLIMGLLLKHRKKKHCQK